MMEDFLELQERVGRLKKEIQTKEQELDKKDQKILELSEKINQLTNESAKNASDTRHFRGMVSILEGDKKNLEKERDRLIKDLDAANQQLKQFATIIETTNQTLQAKEESLLSKEKQLQTKDLLVIEKDEKLEEYRRKFETLSEEKERYQQEKFSFMEQLSKEKVELVEKIGSLEKLIQEYDQKMKDAKKRTRTAEDGLLGQSMEMEKVREELTQMNVALQEANAEIDKLREEKAKTDQIVKQFSKSKSPEEFLAKFQDNTIDSQIAEKYKEHIALLEVKLEKYQRGEIESGTGEQDVFARGTGIYQSISTLMVHFKYKLNNITRSMRMILPEIEDIEKYGLKEIFLNLPNNVLKNLACKADKSKHKELIAELQEKNFKITDYRDSPLFALTIDNYSAAIAVISQGSEKITGIYSDEEELVKLLSQAIMTPFIKGVKIN